MDVQPRVDVLLASYPRRRPDLPPAHRRTYVEHYRLNRSGACGVSRAVVRLESWMHRRVAAPSVSVLEIGAGSLNHLPYHPGAVVYDAVEPFRDLWHDSPHRARVRRIYDDLADVPAVNRYSAIVSVAVLEHLTDLPAILAASALLLADGGAFRAGFPSEGGLLWGLAWRFTTGIEYRLKRGLDYAAIMRHEHVNTAAEILELLRHFYARVEVSRAPMPSAHLSFYTAAIAREPRLARCRSFLSARSAEAARS
jgi:hypothetical protein